MNIDALTKRYMELCLMQNIADMQGYALSWRRLMAAAQVIGFRSLARNARARWRHYRDMAGGEYVRLFEQPFAELILVEAS